jgi:hypothetical protein
VLPQDFSGIDPATLENARERGVQADELFCGYITGALSEIPAGMRQDSVELVWKLTDWWGSKKRGKPVVQHIVHDSEIAGRFDFWCDGVLYDLKCVHTLRKHYPIQVAAYGSLSDLEIEEMMLVHVTERFAKPKLVTVPLSADADWHTVRKAWELQQRLKNGSN